nr:NAD(+) diphosphatase [uncultured Holophaga sp.]
MSFIPGRVLGPCKDLPDLWVVVDQDRALIRERGPEPGLLESSDLPLLGIDPAAGLPLGQSPSRRGLMLRRDAALPLPEGFAWREIRSLFGLLGEEAFALAGRANLLAGWDRAHRLCGACGSGLELRAEEWAKACPACGQVYYPQICPAVIVSVVDGDRILLARNRQHRYSFFSVLAGFVEAGETLEDAVHREVLEEAGITVKNLRYFGSQPWSFPNSLMVGFQADYAGGELNPDPGELLEAGWFTRESLPEIPGSASIAWRLIEAFLRSPQRS